MGSLRLNLLTFHLCVNFKMKTPPISPNIFEDEFSFEEVEQIKEDIPENNIKCFDCLGNVLIKDKRLPPNGFLISGEIKYLFIKGNHSPNLNSTVELFGQIYEKTYAALENFQIFFNMTRKKLLFLDSCAKTSCCSVTGKFSIPIHNEESNFFEIRNQINKWLEFIRDFIISISLDESNYKYIDSVVEIVMPKLHSFRLLLGNLSHLPDYILHHTASSSGNKNQMASYHLFHLHLELRWLHLTITYLLHEAIYLAKLLAFQSQVDDDADLIHQHRIPEVEKYIKHCISELIIVASLRFEKINLNEINQKSFFNCTCLRELWIMILLFVEKLHSDKKTESLWFYINEILEQFLTSSSQISSDSENLRCGDLQFPKSYKCSNPAVFALWALSHLAQLFAYDDDGSIIEIQFTKMESNWQLMDRVLKHIAAQDTPELQMRISLHIVLDIVQIWPPRSEPVTILWEYYHKKLNSTFMLQGAPLSSMAVICNSGQALLDQIRSRLDPSNSLKNATSFELFLRLIFIQLKRRKNRIESFDPRLWQQVRGRIYIKLSASKVSSLRELGFYHLVSLFITLSLSLELNEISKKLHELLSLVEIENLDSARRRVVWLAHMALLLIHASRHSESLEEDLSWLTSTLLKYANQITAMRNQSSDSSTVIRILIDGLKDLLEVSKSAQLEHLLIDIWIPQYLSNASQTDQCRLLDICLLAATRLCRPSTGLNIPLHDALNNHVLTHIRNAAASPSNYPPPFQIADLASALTIAELDRARTENFSQLYIYFTSSGIHEDVIVRFLTQIFSEDRVCRALEEHLQQHYETIAIQAWLRCMVTVSSDSGSSACCDLTQVISRLPEVRALCLLHASSLDSSDPVNTWIQLLSKQSSRLVEIGERIVFKEKCSLYFGQLERAIGNVMKDPKASADIVDRIYSCASKLVFYCGQLIYTKANPKCLLPSLVSLLLLPNAIYKPEFRLHTFVNNSIRRTYALFLQGFWRLDHANDPFISRTIRDLIIHYLNRLNSSSMTTSLSLSAGPFSISRQQTPHKHPLLNCLRNNQSLSRFIFETITNTFLTLRGSNTHPHISSAVSLLLDALEIPTSVPLFADICLGKLFELFVIVGSESAQNWLENSLQIISRLLTHCRLEQLTPTLAMVIRKYLAFKSLLVFRALQTLSSREPALVRSVLPALRDEIASVEQRRGAGVDQLLRSSLTKLENILDNSTK